MTSPPPGTARRSRRWLVILCGAAAVLGLVLVVLGVLGLVSASGSRDDADAAQAEADAIASDAEAAAEEAAAVQESAGEIDEIGQDLADQALDLPLATVDATEAFNTLAECVGSATTPEAYVGCVDQHAAGFAAAVDEEAAELQRLRDATTAAQETIDSQAAGAPEEGES